MNSVFTKSSCIAYAALSVTLNQGSFSPLTALISGVVTELVAVC